MSFNTTIDNLVYSATTQPENMADKPFVSKEWSNQIFDTNTSAFYNSNQIIFDTTTLSNSGAFPNYAEGLIILPKVIRVYTNDANNGDWTATNLKNTDFMLAFKNSHVNLIHSVSINMNNTDLLQPVPLTNAYLSFIQHSEFTKEDELLNAPLHGYCKDSSSSWSYVQGWTTEAKGNGEKWTTGTAPAPVVGDSRGVGLCNNSNFGLINAVDTNDTYNEGMLNRQKLISKYNSNSKNLVLGGDNINRMASNSYISNTVGGKYIFYDVTIRLKDLCPNFFQNFPLALGVKFKITLTLNNNIEFKFRKNTAGNLIYDPSSFVNVTSPTNPLMIAASYNPIVTQAGGNFYPTGAATNDNATPTGNYNFQIDNADANSALIPCGSSLLKKSTSALSTNGAAGDIIYTVSMKIGQNNGVTHSRSQCILYVPSYKMSPNYEKEYLSDSSRIRKVHYTELEYQSFYPNASTQSSSFNVELSSTCVRPKRLIMIPIITAAGNFGINPLSSPFTTEPATTSPCVITSFNCAISNNNIFPNDISYSFDHFLQELNGQTGVNANLVNGLVSSRISMVDFQNNYHYIVCDLSRRLAEMDMVSSSIRVRGTVQSPLPLEIHCFIEKEKIIEIDVCTGALISRS